MLTLKQLRDARAEAWKAGNNRMAWAITLVIDEAVCADEGNVDATLVGYRGAQKWAPRRRLAVEVG